MSTGDQGQYGQFLLSRLGEFYQERLLCDYVLKVNEEKFEVHKVVLAGCSDYFRALFTHGMRESRSNVLQLDGLDTMAMRQLVNFAYSGKLHLNLDNIENVLSVASFLQMTSAMELCSSFLKSNITFDNAEKLSALAETHGLVKVNQYKKKYILDNFYEFSQTDQFLKLDAKTLADYLADDSLKTTTEARLLKCALRWYDHDPEARKNVAHSVFEKIRFTLDGWPTIEYAQEREPFKSNISGCMEILNYASNYMQNASRKHLYQCNRTRVRYTRKTLVQIGGEHHIMYSYGDELAGTLVGYTHNHYFHLDNQRWFPLGVVGTFDSRSHCVFMEVNDFGILIGGYLYSWVTLPQAQKFPTNEVKLFVPGGFALWDMPYMLEDRAHHAAVRIGDFLYVAGGMGHDAFLSSVERFNMREEVWEYVTSLPSSLIDHAAAECQNKMYVSGGIEGNSDVGTDKVQVYDPETNRWSTVNKMLTGRLGHTMTKVGDRLIVCGGRLDDQSPRCLITVEAYSPSTNQWTYISPLRNDTSYMAAVVLEEKLLILGGVNSVQDHLQSIQQYNTELDKWTLYGSLPTPLGSFGCCALTVKMTDNGQEDTDSVMDAYNVWPSGSEPGSDEEDHEVQDAIAVLNLQNGL
ncbi:kelch-like protein 26 [Lingula anatina]|uniref:Kelch-like protein 26 n=1 Tax=Lingula anatina TaxID=7574 RepID=A0A1S3IRD3_LINAN|nr:kelch-like protein 26 [Lingula anatina]|eukprot:XP_013400496.1 kelch-like protein 26 [Lingula anatina]